MIEHFLPAFVTLFVIIDPVGLIPIFLTLTNEGNAKYRRVMAVKSVLIAFGVLSFFAFFGKPVMDALGISMPAFRMAGGALLFMIGVQMVFEKRARQRKDRAAKHQNHPSDELQSGSEELPSESVNLELEDVSAFPLAIPFLSGPGAIATVMLLMSEHQGEVVAQSAIVIAAGLVLLTSLVLFLLANVMSRFLPFTLTVVISRLLGMLLAAMAIQFIIDGIKATFSLS